MCEAHIADTIRHAFPHAAHVSASRSKKEATFVTETPVEEAVIKKAIDETGYTYKGMKTEPYERKASSPAFWLSHEWFCFLGRHHPLYGNKPRRLLRFS